MEYFFKNPRKSCVAFALVFIFVMEFLPTVTAASPILNSFETGVGYNVDINNEESKISEDTGGNETVKEDSDGVHSVLPKVGDNNLMLLWLLGILGTVLSVIITLGFVYEQKKNFAEASRNEEHR